MNSQNRDTSNQNSLGYNDMPNLFKVLIADHFALTRSGLAALLDDQLDFQVISEVQNCDRAIECAERLMPDLVIINRNLPANGYLKAAYTIRNTLERAKVVIVADEHNDLELNKVIEAGCQGYVTSDITPASLFQMFRGVMGGELAVSRRAMGMLLRDFSKQSHVINHHPAVLLKTLGVREKQVLSLLVKSGASNKKIASELGIAENTVKNHLKSILEKLNVKNRVQAAIFASENGFD